MGTRINVKMSERLFDELKVTSEKQGRTYSEIVRQLIVDYVKKERVTTIGKIIEDKKDGKHNG
jgi:metal-responsive CopG/Arc/MetJ family transcriptional regulator